MRVCFGLHSFFLALTFLILFLLAKVLHTGRRRQQGNYALCPIITPPSPEPSLVIGRLSLECFFFGLDSIPESRFANCCFMHFLVAQLAAALGLLQFLQVLSRRGLSY
jgi:hypothetical protein